MLKITLLAAALAATTTAHTAAWTAEGMYCALGNTTDATNRNNNLPVGPLYNLTKADWWFQHDRGCDNAPPAENSFLEIPAGGTFTVELAHNRAQTTLEYDGQFMSDWPDGQQHPDDMNAPDGGCVADGALHTSNQSYAAGTAWAISYQSDFSAVTLENLAVFSVLEHTPWKRLATYSVPAALPACPPSGCTCAWLWVPYHCGQPNMYMQGFKCNVTNATSTTPVAAAKAPVFCREDKTKCLGGAKQMIVYNQLEGNNVNVTSMGPNGWWDVPMYNEQCGFSTGAQNDIFESESTASA